MIGFSGVFSMKTSKILYFYIALWALYYLQGTLYPTGSIISQVTLLVALLLSLYYIIAVNKIARNPRYIQALNMMVALVTIYGFIRLLESDSTGTKWDVFLKEFYYSLLPIYVFYYYSLKGQINKWMILLFAIIFIIVTIFYYFKALNEALDLLGSENVTNNSGYYFVPLVPLLLLLDIKKILKYVLLLVIGGFVLMSAKRGAILTYVICSIEYLYFELLRASNKTKLFVLFFSAFILVAGYQVSMKVIESNVYLSMRLDDTRAGNTSSRDIIYGKLVDNIENQNSFVKLLLGNGVNGTMKISGSLAHNDWLEIAIDMGIVGLLIYVFYYIAFYSLTKRSHRDKQTSALLIILTFCFVRSFFSMSINDMYIVTTFVMGYCIGQSEYQKRLNNIRKVNV